MKFYDAQIEEQTYYTGVITGYTITEEKTHLRLWVELEDLPNAKFLKSVRYCELLQSPMAKLCKELQITDEQNNVYFEELRGLEVEVTLYLGRDGNYYIGEILLAGEAEDE